MNQKHKKLNNRSETGWKLFRQLMFHGTYHRYFIYILGLRRKLTLCILETPYMCKRWDSTILIRLYTIIEMMLLLYTERNHLCTRALLISLQEIARPIFRNFKESCKMTFILSMWSCLFKITTFEPLLI